MNVEYTPPPAEENWRVRQRKEVLGELYPWIPDCVVVLFPQDEKGRWYLHWIGPPDVALYDVAWSDSQCCSVFIPQADLSPLFCNNREELLQEAAKKFAQGKLVFQQRLRGPRSLTRAP